MPAPGPTIRQRILETLRERLQAISTSAGFATDAGGAVYLGFIPDLGEDDPDVALAMAVGTDEIRHQGVNVLRVLPVEVQAITLADLAEPWVAVEAAIGDVKRAVELDDRTLGGLLSQRMEVGSTRTLEREPGFRSVGAGITYFAPYLEGWGSPLVS